MKLQTQSNRCVNSLSISFSRSHEFISFSCFRQFRCGSKPFLLLLFFYSSWIFGRRYTDSMSMQRRQEEFIEHRHLISLDVRFLTGFVVFLLVWFLFLSHWCTNTYWSKREISFICTKLEIAFDPSKRL